MLRKLIDLSPDLKRLWDEGYELELRDSHLLVHSIPYLNSVGEIVDGILVTNLELSGDVTNKPSDHVARFIGEFPPCDSHGQELTAIIIGKNQENLGPNLVTNYTFSSKPTHGNGYGDYYEKLTTYINIVSTPAKAKDASTTERTSRVIETDSGDDYAFKYLDTNTARAQIGTAAAKLAGQRIAIVGLGGTGSYILDLVAKSPVQEIHLFDGDQLKSNNAFRSPGAASAAELRERPYKADYFSAIYDKMRYRVVPHNYYLDATNLNELTDFSYVFVSVDRGTARKEITEYLLGIGVAFIDVGMGLHNIDDSIMGTVRVTVGTADARDHLANRMPCESAVDNDYLLNIQIAELNALNAAFAVVKWKKMSGFYHDYEHEGHLTYTLEMNLLRSEDRAA